MQHMKTSKRKQQMLMALAAVGGVSSVMTASAEILSADDFDLTTQAKSAPFPVMFDRPSGINAAALAGSVRSLGSESELYKSALAAVPELADANKMNALLNDALSEDKETMTASRTIILKLINWYNSLGGFQLKTQAGAAYTIENLDDPINTIAVGFANKEANAKVSDLIQKEFGNVKTTGDVMRILERHQPGVSTGFTQAFNAYNAKVSAADANIEELSKIAQVQPLLASYEKMYSDGAASIRGALLKTEGTKEATIAFFESAVITGRMDGKSEAPKHENPKPATNKNVKTRWVDDQGRVLSPEESGEDYKSEKSFDGFKLREARVDNGVKTYIYEKAAEKTIWVDSTGKRIKDDATGTFPDKDGNDVPGYTFIRSETRKDGANTVTINLYKKAAESKPSESTPKPSEKPAENPLTNNDTYWFDGTGKELKAPAKGQLLPDNEGDDFPGYKLLKAYTVTQASLEGDLKGSKFKVGDVINIYEKSTEVTKPTEKPTEKPTDKPAEKPAETSSETPKSDGIITKWVDEKGNAVKEQMDGAHPDSEGDDVPGYRALRTIKDAKGNITNIYEKLPEVHTTWVDEDGNTIKELESGVHPDKEGDDVAGYKLLHTKTSDSGNTVNTYHKIMTSWVDEEGKELKPTEATNAPAKEGDEVEGNKFVRSETKENGDVVNIFHKPVTMFVDENGKDIQNPKLETDGKTIKGYKLLHSQNKANGDIVHTYHKITTKWLDKDGKVLKEEMPGELVDKEGKDVPGYTKVETKVDEKTGDITNVYQKETKPVTTHWVDKDGRRLSADETGKDFSKEKTIDGYRVVDVRTSADGTEKFYVYEKIATPKQLPQTGDTGGFMALVGGLFTGLGGVAAVKPTKRKEK